MMNVASWLPSEPKSTRRPTISSAPDVRVEIDVVSEHHIWTGMTSNIAGGGVFIATYRHVPIGTRLTVEFALDDGEEPIVAHTEVRWIRFSSDGGAPPGLGLRFIGVDYHAQRRIAAFLERRPAMLFEA